MEEGLHQEIKVLQDNKTVARRDLEANQNDIKGRIKMSLNLNDGGKKDI